MPDIGALAAGLLADVRGRDDAGGKAALGGRRADRDFGGGVRLHGPGRLRRDIDRPGQAVEDRLPLAEQAEILVAGADPHPSG